MPAAPALPDQAMREQVLAHRDGQLLILGPQATGRTSLLAERLGALVSAGVRAEQVILLARTRAGAAALRSRCEERLGSHGELSVGRYEDVAEQILREYPVEAGLDPFFTTVSAPDRLAILLDRVDELPLRRHEIRGNPAGLLARLLRRIDVLKAEGVAPERLRDWALERERSASSAPERERAKRETEFADLYARHDRMLQETGSLDDGDMVATARALLDQRADVAEETRARFGYVMVDELEDASTSGLGLVAALAGDDPNLVCAFAEGASIRRFRGAGGVPLGWFRATYPDAAEVVLSATPRFGAKLAAAAQAASALVPDASAKPLATAAEIPAGEVRVWRCEGERAEAQAAAREIEGLLAAGRLAPERICVVAAAGWRQARLVAAALEERAIPFRPAGDEAFFGRPEIRDALAWLRALADPNDAAAVVRAVTRPPVDLRSVDLARVSTIARRRKLDMVSALGAALESPQLRPEARDRIQSFLKLHAAASQALERMRADVFVRRLIERIGMRRHRLFAATPETAERLVNLARLAELASDWSRRVPRGPVRDFIRHIAAVAEASDVGREDVDPPAPGAVVLAEPAQLKGLEFDAAYVLGLHEQAFATPPWEDRWVPEELAGGPFPAAGEELSASRRAALGHLALTRARQQLVLSWPSSAAREGRGPAPVLAAVRDLLELEEEEHAEEIFGPAEGLHGTYRMIRDEVLEASWRAGSALSEMRLDTGDDVNRAVARYLELIKLAALLQRPGDEAAPETLAAVNELLGRVATPEQRAALETSALDTFVLGDEREQVTRREHVASRNEPSLEQFIPRRGEGIALSASDIDLYRTCPLRYKFARVFVIPQDPTINQRFGILVHQVLERFHAEAMRAGEGPEAPGGGSPGSLDRLLALFEAGWRRAGFGSSDDELQYRDRAVAALARYHERHQRERPQPVWLERRFSFQIGRHSLAGRVDRVDKRSDGGYELIDYKTGELISPGKLADDVQLSLYRVAAREAWELEATQGSYWFVLADERLAAPVSPGDAERVERTVLEVAGGIESQDFEPRPSYEICSWCDYRLICPASEA